MTPRSGEELSELEARQEPRLVKALEMVAPGTAVREGIDNIVHARTGGLLVIGDPDELSFLFSGGIKLDIDYTPALLYQLAKMDGAIALNGNATRIAWCNVQLMPDPTILSSETGTRHRTAERVSKQTVALDGIARLAHQDLLDFGRLAELLGHDRKVNTLDFPVSPRGFRILGRIPRLPKLVVQNIVREFRGLDEILAATDPELESVDGVGEIRAKDIREGLRRLQEINLVDRYLQT